MKLKLYRSATVGIDINGFKILQDPWLTDGEYFGSWSHYPYFDLSKNLDEINSYDAIYISHIHPDHCSDNTMKVINKNIPVYIHKFHAPFLKAKLERIGFSVIEIENGKRTEISQDIFLNIFAADNCDPELCYNFIGCADLNVKEGSQQIDTLSILDNNKNTLMNVNDCPFDLAKSTFSKIKEEYSNIDMLLVGYQNASPYPQCFENLDTKHKIEIGKKVSINCLNRTLSYIKDLKPNYYLPFAGTYALSGKLASLDKIRGVPNIDQAHEYILKNQTFSKPIKINPGSSFDLISESYSNEYKKFNLNEYRSYVKNILQKKKLDYEEDPQPTFEELYELSKTAYRKFLDKKLINNVEIKTDIYIDIEEKYLKLPKNSENLEIVEKKNFSKNEKYILYKTDLRLLKRLLMGPRYAHWNNAEIGSHIKFYRNPDIFERELYSSMCYFHN